MCLESETQTSSEKPIKETTHHWPCCLIDEDAAPKHHSNERLKPEMKTKRIEMEKLAYFPFIVKKWSLSKVFSFHVGCPTSNTTFSHRVMIFPPIKVSDKCYIHCFLSSLFPLLHSGPPSSHFPSNFISPPSLPPLLSCLLFLFSKLIISIYQTQIGAHHAENKRLTNSIWKKNNKKTDYRSRERGTSYR